MSRFEEARELARSNPMLSQAEIGRAVGLSRQGVALALRRDGLRVCDGRTTRTYSRAVDARSASVTEVRRKLESSQPLTREERHLLWQDYRRRQYEAAAQ